PRTSPRKRNRTIVSKVRDLPRREPIGLTVWRSDEMRVTLAKLVEQNHFSLAHIDHVALAQYADCLQHLPKVLTHHNIETLAKRREMEYLSGYPRLRRWAGWLENKRWESFEIAASRGVEAIVTVSKVESSYFSERVPQTPVHLVPNGVDTCYFQPPIHPNQQRGLLFTGRMDYAPNVDAVRWFCAEILPLVRRRCPGVTLTIVGRSPTPGVQALANLPGFRSKVAVDDVRPYYGSASVFIVPLRFGGGTRLKILEAMSVEMPVVSTKLGCEGLDLVPGDDYLAADTPEGFADAVAGLLGDRTERDRLGRRGRQTATERFDWAVIGDAQEKAYRQALTRRAH
ncbi:MAG: glycosyltransferase, partial [Chloroflexi bacterium]|nr:glycosyltransferase [Chloroflexota bacterium]